MENKVGVWGVLLSFLISLPSTAHPATGRFNAEEVIRYSPDQGLYLYAACHKSGLHFCYLREQQPISKPEEVLIWGEVGQDRKIENIVLVEPSSSVQVSDCLSRLARRWPDEIRNTKMQTEQQVLLGFRYSPVEKPSKPVDCSIYLSDKTNMTSERSENTASSFLVSGASAGTKISVLPKDIERTLGGLVKCGTSKDLEQYKMDFWLIRKSRNPSGISVDGPESKAKACLQTTLKSLSFRPQDETIELRNLRFIP